MNLRKSLKYSLLILGVLSGVVLTLGSTTDTAHAMGGIYTGKNHVTWAPQWSSNSSYAQSGTGTYAGSGASSWAAQGMKEWTAKSGTTFKYKNMGKDPNSGKQVDVWATLSDFKGVGHVGYKTHNQMSINMNSGGSESMRVKFTFRYAGTSKEVKWNNDIIGLSYSDLEPAKLGLWGDDPVMYKSFNQSVTSLTDTSSWNPWSTSIGRNTWINQNQASKGIFQMKEGMSFPRNYPSHTGKGQGYDPRKKKVVTEPNGDDPMNLHYIWSNYGSRDLNPAIHYSGAIAEYKATGTKTISILLKGHSSGNNEFIFTGAKVAPKKKTTISKSITYNSKTSKSNTLKNYNDSMVYNLNATVSAKKGAYLLDNLPKRFTATKITGVTNFNHTSLAKLNSTHQFKATLANDKLDGKNKKVTFHITGNMGTWMDKHPNYNLKWPVANHTTWYQKSVGTLTSNKVTTNYKPGKDKISKSITYNGKTSTSNTLKDKNDPMTYNLKATLNKAKKGAYISDAIPHRFTVTSVSGVSGFTHNSVADINKTHQFKASINTTKYQTATNKVVTFHLAGNVGEWMSKHPNTSLKWPFYNHAIWHKTSTDTPGTPSNKVKTTFGEDKVNPTKHKVVFNFYDFDHHTSLIRVVAAQQVTVA